MDQVLLYSKDQTSQSDQKIKTKIVWKPWSSGMGGDLCSKGCEFESKYRILDGHFSRTNLL